MKHVRGPLPRDKWNAIYRNAPATLPPPCLVLSEHLHLLPEHGTSMDVACGLGGNAVALAHHGLDTTAWDISEVAVERLRTLADSHRLPVRAEVRDLESCDLPCEAFDVIVVSRFLLRPLACGLMDALKPGGLLFYQTYLLDKDPAVGPTDPSFLLSPNELRDLFTPLRLLFYREEGQIGDRSAGFRNEAMLIGQRA